MTRLVRGQLVAFVVLALLGIIYIGAKYVRLDQLMGIGIYRVTLQLPTTGGLYSNAEVTYRGVPVGRVGEMSLTDSGVSAQLQMQSGAPKIPAALAVVVADRSAIGEQYVDLQPKSDGGPYLQNGSTIYAGTTPVPIDRLLASVDGFARSVPLDKLHTTIVELGRALNGQGDNLRSVVESLNNFSSTWDRALPQTLRLISDGRVVLDTQAAQSDSILAFSVGLDRLSAQLRASDPDLRRLITNGKPASDQLDQLITESGPGLTTDLTNLRLTGISLSPKAWALQPVLQQLPGLALGPSSTAPGDGTTHFGAVLETNNPPPCTIGYEGTQRILDQMKARNPDFDDSRDDFPFNADAHCAAPQGSVSDVRGGARAMLADPQVPQPWDDRPKTMPDTLNLTPFAQQLAELMGIRNK